MALFTHDTMTKKAVLISFGVIILLVAVYTLYQTPSKNLNIEIVPQAKTALDLLIQDKVIHLTGIMSFPVPTKTVPSFFVACFEADVWICKDLKSTGRWEVFNGQEYILQHYFTHPKQSYFLDLGANLGVFSLFLASKGNWKGIAVEPLYGSVIEFNSAMNNLQPFIKVEKAALVSQGRGTMKMMIEKGNPGASFIGSDGNVEVKTATVDDIIEKYERSGFIPKDIVFDFMKLDIEGYEVKALHGAKKLLGNRRAKIIQMEIVESWLVRAGDSPQALVELLNGYGYTLYWGIDKTKPIDAKSIKYENNECFAFRNDLTTYQ